MGRVFDALRREQKRKDDAGERDPLANSIILPETVKLGDPAAELESIAPIGVPSGPRSTEGTLLPGAMRRVASAPDLAKESTVKVTTGVANGNGYGTGQTSGQTNGQISGQAIVSGGANAGASAPVSLAPAENSAGETAKFRPPQTTALPQTVPTVAVNSAEAHQRLVMLRGPVAAGCEQYRTLRTQLLHATEKQLVQTIVVTSALAGEGKTSTAINLAFAIAQSKNRRVLLIDGDLRRPSVGPYLNVQPGTADFADVLAGRATVMDALLHVDGTGLYLLPTREMVNNPSELLSNEQFAQMLAQLRNYFDFILIDSPPVMPFADARLLANQTDTVLLVVRSGFAQYDIVEQAIEAVSAKRILGVVLNGVEHSRESEYYNYYYQQKEHSGEVGLHWHQLLPALRDTWLGRKLKL